MDAPAPGCAFVTYGKPRSRECDEIVIFPAYSAGHGGIGARLVNG